jgi:hypothetical protein
MSRVIGLHETALHHGVSEAEFEQFLREELAPAAAKLEHLKLYVIKGDRGDRMGRYLTVVEFDSVDERNRQWPERDQASEEGKQEMEKLQPVIQKWQTYANFGNPAFTDYVEIE